MSVSVSVRWESETKVLRSRMAGDAGSREVPFVLLHSLPLTTLGSELVVCRAEAREWGGARPGSIPKGTSNADGWWTGRRRT
ncbi:hypothetical protein CTRI78_v000089 [Colletotrichum trifolii]|uniref:Uncharacterized protein n=1 Tax=Colletotrichum trifolii TaxID=5466 RepID=A0A4R8RST1_COLTR|nr:hypothetical protein CTRI78_v000089 [Colletotrichum trifolii]